MAWGGGVGWGWGGGGVNRKCVEKHAKAKGKNEKKRLTFQSATTLVCKIGEKLTYITRISYLTNDNNKKKLKQLYIYTRASLSGRGDGPLMRPPPYSSSGRFGPITTTVGLTITITRP